MKKIVVLLIFIFILFSFCAKETKNKSPYIIAFVEDVYIDKFSEIENGTDLHDSIIGEGEKIEKFLGIFPKENDTVTIYKLNSNSTEDLEKFSFWYRKSNKINSIIFHFSEPDEDIKVVFKTNNSISIGNDEYFVNNEYYKYLKKNILINKSVLDLAFFLKDGLGDYAQHLLPLNKNWRNQDENTTHKIISAKIKNKNFQTDNQYFNYTINYKYTKKGILKSVSGNDFFNKKYINQNKKYIHYIITKSINERAIIKENLYTNKKTLFDSIIGIYEQNSNSKTTYYTKYQSKLKTKRLYSKPKNLQELLYTLNVK
jgi:hypothetical protein